MEGEMVIEVGTKGVVKDVRFVALTKTKGGGDCRGCGGHIPVNQPIFKYPNGKWVCYWCSVDAESDEDAPGWLVS